MTTMDRANEKVAPVNNPAVARIMAEQGVGRTRAYAIWRDQQTNRIDTSNVSSSQRLAVMSCLVNKGVADISAINNLFHAEGIRITPHDITKTLWALQKARWVKFRERGNGHLYAIKVRDEGLAGYAQLMEHRADEATKNGHPEPAVEYENPSEDPTFPEALAAAYVDEEQEENIVARARPVIPIADFPLIFALVKRAKTVEKLNAAARLLEEAGEDEMAIDVMDKANLSPLEQEVINLIARVS